MRGRPVVFLGSGGHDRDRTMVVAVVDVRVMKAALHQEVHVVAMGNLLAVLGGAVHGLAVGGVDGGHLEVVLVDVTRVGVMEVTVVEVIHVVLVPDRRVTAGIAMDVRMLIMGLAFHRLAPFRAPHPMGAPRVNLSYLRKAPPDAPARSL